MKTDNIKSENWKSFTENFSRDHKKKFFNLEEMTGSGERNTLAEDLKLIDIAIDIEPGENNNSIIIVGQDSDKEVNHTIVKTNNLSLEKNNEGGETALYIGSEVGNTTVLNFRPIPSQKNIFSYYGISVCALLNCIPVMTEIIKEKPIGVFDSGIGGLTVVKRFLSSLPNENIVYFGDTARVPYGSKSNATVIEYSLQDAQFLINKKVKAIVVACNTASSVAIDEIRKAFDVSVIGMIGPGSKSAIKETKTKRVGVIGTRATINNNAYAKRLKSYDSSIEVFEKACPLFVPLAEEGWINHEATYKIAEEYLTELKEKEIDTLVLGCTHYPILSEVIQKVIGINVILIDSGVASAEIVKEELKKNNLLSDSKVKGRSEFFVSDIPAKFKEIAELFLGEPVDNLHKVDLESLIAG
jgi:glutamate racemase